MVSKIAALLLLRQIFSISKKMRIAIKVGIAAIIITYGPNLILGAYYLAPRSGEAWKDFLVSERSLKLNILVFEEGVLGVVLDLYIFFLPFPMLRQLNLKFSKRLQLSLLFGTAFMYGSPLHKQPLDTHRCLFLFKC